MVQTVKESACNAGDLGSIPGWGRSSGEGKHWLSTPVFLPGESHGQMAEARALSSWIGYWTQSLSNFLKDPCHRLQGLKEAAFCLLMRDVSPHLNNRQVCCRLFLMENIQPQVWPITLFIYPQGIYQSCSHDDPQLDNSQGQKDSPLCQ